jgi:hypothetical protein
MIKDIKRGSMGTAIITAKFPKMRKAQEFIVYPLSKGNDAKVLKLQSDTRMALLDTMTGIVTLTKPYQNGAYFHHLQIGQTHKFEISMEDLENVKINVFKTASAKAGNSVISCDNSGAVNVFDL